MELDGSSNDGSLWCLGGGGGGGGGGGRMHWITEWLGGRSAGARNSLPGGAGSSSRRTHGTGIPSNPVSDGSSLGVSFG